MRVILIAAMTPSGVIGRTSTAATTQDAARCSASTGRSSTTSSGSAATAARRFARCGMDEPMSKLLEHPMRCSECGGFFSRITFYSRFHIEEHIRLGLPTEKRKKVPDGDV